MADRKSGRKNAGLLSEAAKLPAKLKVFISYSRAQVAFADQLELALRDKGHEVLIDRHSIAKGEDFQKRLGEMILDCDTVVFILSDESARSDVCAWEVDEAKRLVKRMLVVTLGDITPGVSPPSALAGIDWIHCWSNPRVPGSSLIKGVIELDAALRTDLGWMRYRTDLQERTANWTLRGAGADSPHLLRDEQVAEALAWSRAAPKDHAIPDDVARFIAASEEHERRLKSKALAQARAVRRVGFGVGGVAALFMIAALGLGWIAVQQTEEAQKQQAAAARQSSAVMTMQADSIDAKGFHETALLMALYADPTAQGTEASRRFDGDKGYGPARACKARTQTVACSSFSKGMGTPSPPPRSRRMARASSLRPTTRLPASGMRKPANPS